jgi:Domain of unknown function (DUF5753)
VDEAELRGPVDGPAVMTANSGISSAPREIVTVQVVPFSVTASPGLECAFTLLDFPDETMFPTEVYAESIAGGLYPEAAGEIARLCWLMSAFRGVALSEAQLADLAAQATRCPERTDNARSL